VPTPAYADGKVQTVTVGTAHADGFFGCVVGHRHLDGVP
jgi:hypothetical protein